MQVEKEGRRGEGRGGGDGDVRGQREVHNLQPAAHLQEVVDGGEAEGGGEQVEDKRAEQQVAGDEGGGEEGEGKAEAGEEPEEKGEEEGETEKKKGRASERNIRTLRELKAA